jgi:hypothetical protein
VGVCAPIAVGANGAVQYTCAAVVTTLATSAAPQTTVSTTSTTATPCVAGAACIANDGGLGVCAPVSVDANGAVVYTCSALPVTRSTTQTTTTVMTSTAVSSTPTPTMTTTTPMSTTAFACAKLGSACALADGTAGVCGVVAASSSGVLQYGCSPFLSATAASQCALGAPCALSTGSTGVCAMVSINAIERSVCVAITTSSAAAVATSAWSAAACVVGRSYVNVRGQACVCQASTGPFGSECVPATTVPSSTAPCVLGTECVDESGAHGVCVYADAVGVVCVPASAYGSPTCTPNTLCFSDQGGVGRCDDAADCIAITTLPATTAAPVCAVLGQPCVLSAGAAGVCAYALDQSLQCARAVECPPNSPTGDVTIDFPIASAPSVVSIGDVVSLPPHWPYAHSGFAVQDVRLRYRLATDALEIGVNCYGICGDADGDGDASRTSAALASVSGVDIAMFGGSETALVAFDFSGQGGDIAIG